MFCKVSVTEWEGSDGAAGNCPTKNNPSARSGVRLRSQEVLLVRGCRILVHSLTLFHMAMILGRRNEQSILSHGKASQD